MWLTFILRHVETFQNLALGKKNAFSQTLGGMHLFLLSLCLLSHLEFPVVFTNHYLYPRAVFH